MAFRIRQTPSLMPGAPQRSLPAASGVMQLVVSYAAWAWHVLRRNPQTRAEVPSMLVSIWEDVCGSVLRQLAPGAALSR